jgi:hypothetical protein
VVIVGIYPLTKVTLPRNRQMIIGLLAATVILSGVLVSPWLSNLHIFYPVATILLP